MTAVYDHDTRRSFLFSIQRGRDRLRYTKQFWGLDLWGQKLGREIWGQITESNKHKGKIN